MNRINLVAVFILIVLAACQGAPLLAPTAAPVLAPTAAPAATQAAPTTSAPTVVPTVAAIATSATPTLYKDATQPVEKRVADLLAGMTLAEKIGQMTQAENNSVVQTDVTKYALGSVLSGGGSYSDNSPEAWRRMVESYEQAALKTRLGIPLLFGLDAVHGHAHIAGAVYFPHNVGLGATRDAALVEKIGRATAEQVSATAVQWDFAPVLAVVQDIRWGRTYEGYSENTALVTELGAAYIKGMQDMDGKPALTNPQTVLATAKHFLGDGGTKFGTSKTFNQVPYLIDQGDTQMNEAHLRALFLPPYKAAVDAGAESVMASYSSWNGLKMHAQKKLLTAVLKDELGFKGFVISDWQGIDQISDDYYQAVVTGINAGVDMVMVPYDYRKFISTLTQAVDKSDVPMTRIDDAVSRILTAKFNKGLFEQPIPQTEAASILNNAAHKALARAAVQKSLVLLENKNQTLPLKKDVSTIFVAGVGAGTTGYQNGGWTLEWQGTEGNAGGTSLLNAIKAAVSPSTTVQYNNQGKFDAFKDAQGSPQKADVAIVVLAEPPYAEGLGDRATLDLSEADIAMIERAKAASDRVTVILLSGRPLVITDALPLADAFVAAWLPGSEGEGVTDVLFGDAPFSGKTAYTWPRTDAQLPFDFANIKTEGCDAPLFPYGFGLTTQDPSPQLLDCP